MAAALRSSGSRNPAASSPHVMDAVVVEVEPVYVRSPGGWVAPQGQRAGWDWVPPGGAEPRLHEAPGWARWMFHRPVIQRFAHTWMWKQGLWSVEPAPGYVVVAGGMVARGSRLRRS